MKKDEIGVKMVKKDKKRINEEKNIDRRIVKRYASEFKSNLLSI